MALKTALKTLISGKSLTEDAVFHATSEIFEGNADSATIAGFLAALAVRGETSDHLVGAARAMRKKMKRIQTPPGVVVDTCGTGGDGADTFNISTTAAFVVAGAGILVAKHGNRAVSSKCGSADVLEALGVRLDIDPEDVEEALHHCGIGFLFAPNFHGAVRHAGPARKALGVRTLFNAVGPLANPASASCQVIGVFRPDLTEAACMALKRLGSKRALVVHGHDGLDELSVCEKTRVTELRDGTITTRDLDPTEFFGTLATPSDLKGGDAETNAAITRAVLSGETGARRDIILLNAGAAIFVSGKAASIADGIRMAEKSIDSGRALSTLEALIAFTEEAAA